MWILSLHLIFTFPRELRSTIRVPTDFNNADFTPAKATDFIVKNFNRFLHNTQTIIHLDLLERNNQRFIHQTLLQIRDMEDIMNITEFSWQIKPVCYRSNPFQNCERSYIPRIQFAPLPKTYNALPRRYLQQNPVAYFKLQRLATTIGIALLTIPSCCQAVTDLYDLLGSLVHKFRAGELTLNHLGPTKGRPAFPPVKSLERSCLDARMVAVVVGEFHQR